MESSFGVGNANSDDSYERFYLRGLLQICRLDEDNEHRFNNALLAFVLYSWFFCRVFIWLSKVQLANTDSAYLHWLFAVCLYNAEPVDTISSAVSSYFIYTYVDFNCCTRCFEH